MSAPPNGALFYEPRAKPLSTVGLQQPGAYYQFYLTGTTTPANVYADGLLTVPLSQTPGTGQTTCASDGRLVPIYLDPATFYRVQLYSSSNVLLEDTDPYVPAPSPTQSQIAFILYPTTAAETSAGITPVNFLYPPGNALRYGVDPTGVTDSTTAIQTWINASWSMYNYTDGQGLWSGGGGANPVLTLPPGKFKVSNTMYLPTGVTLTGTGHPANTTNHTRIIMNSTGTTPARVWSAGLTIPNIPSGYCLIVPASPNGFYYSSSSNGGVTGGSTPAWPTTVGLTVVDGAVTWTCVGATSAGDNRNIPMFKFRRGTLPSGGSLANSAMTSTIQEIEFWYVTQGNSFSNPLGGPGISIGDYPGGAIFYIDVDTADFRFVDCVFQNSPCAIKGSGVGSATVTRPDGFPGNRGIGFYMENCEFDAAAAHFWFQNCALDLQLKECDFFGSVHKFEGCSGNLVYQSGRWHGGAWVDAGGYLFPPGGNTLSILSVTGVDMQPNVNFPIIYAASTGMYVDISENTASTPATIGGIVVGGATRGRICNNGLESQGANAPAGTGYPDYSAAIKLLGCSNLLVSGNNISASFSASYNGFGILTGPAGATNSTGNFIQGNSVSAPYNGTTFNGQSRYINAQTSADVVGMNYQPVASPLPTTGPAATLRTGIAYGTTPTFDATTGNSYVINISNGTAFTLGNPTNPSIGQIIDIMFRNISGGSVGTISFGTAYKVFTTVNPNNGGSISIKFQFDGTNWVEQYRSAGSVPN